MDEEGGAEIARGMLGCEVDVGVIAGEAMAAVGGVGVVVVVVVAVVVVAFVTAAVVMELVLTGGACAVIQENKAEVAGDAVVVVLAWDVGVIVVAGNVEVYLVVGAASS